MTAKQDLSELLGRYKISTTATAEYHIDIGSRMFGVHGKPMEEEAKQAIRDLYTSRSEELASIEMELSDDRLFLRHENAQEEFTITYSSAEDAIHITIVDEYDNEIAFEIKSMGKDLIFFELLGNMDDHVEHALSDAVWEKK
jgi:hypothetical protein